MNYLSNFYAIVFFVVFLKKKYRIRETLDLSTDADRSGPKKNLEGVQNRYIYFFFGGVQKNGGEGQLNVSPVVILGIKKLHMNVWVKTCPWEYLVHLVQHCFRAKFSFKVFKKFKRSNNIANKSGTRQAMAGSPFSVIWFKTRPGDLVVPDPFGR